jgi:hypothetical protein
VQFVGTLYFNVSTGVAMVTDLSAQAAHRHVWRSDAIGSVCFLVSSGLAWYEVCHGWSAWRPRDRSWRITLANLIGSIAFGISAVAGYINPVTGQVYNAARGRHADPDRRGMLFHRCRTAVPGTHRGRPQSGIGG